MVHVGALPGTPRACLSPRELVQRACDEARLLVQAGFEGIIIENMHDRPYLRDGVGAEITACMTAVAAAVRAVVDEAAAKGSGAGKRAPCLGIQVLGGGAMEALAVAHAAEFDFVRCENFVFAHVADEGLMDRAQAGPLLRYRAAIGAQRIAVLADLKKKHASHAVTADLDVAACARAAEFFLADGVIVTGSETGVAAEDADVRAARTATHLPVLVGSGATPDNVETFLRTADAVIVGSWIKKEGHWENPVDPERAREFMAAARRACTST